MNNQEAIDLLDNLIGMISDNQDSDYDEALKLGIKALSADVRENIHGHWKSEDERVPLEESLLYRCSECNKVSVWQTNFCSNCGADMRGKAE